MGSGVQDPLLFQKSGNYKSPKLKSQRLIGMKIFLVS